jgi:hypothetical protein
MIELSQMLPNRPNWSNNKVTRLTLILTLQSPHAIQRKVSRSLPTIMQSAKRKTKNTLSKPSGVSANSGVITTTR